MTDVIGWFLDLGQLNPALETAVALLSTLVVYLFIKIKENKKMKRNYVISEQEGENEEKEKKINKCDEWLHQIIAQWN